MSAGGEGGGATTVSAVWGGSRSAAVSAGGEGGVGGNYSVSCMGGSRSAAVSAGVGGRGAWGGGGQLQCQGIHCAHH